MIFQGSGLAWTPGTGVLYGCTFAIQCIWLLYHMVDRTVFKNRQKKSHSILRAKRATFTFWVAQSLLKMPKVINFWRVFENSNATFLVIFKHCGSGGGKECRGGVLTMLMLAISRVERGTAELSTW